MRRLSILVMLLMVAAAVVLVGCSKTTKTETNTAEMTTTAQAKAAETTTPGIVTTKSGLRYEDLVVGKGPEAKNGDKVVVHYTLWLDNNGQKGTMIQSSKQGGQSFPFTVGQPGLIDGWNEGMLGMKAGGTRRLYIPSNLGYGRQGRPPVIPPSADLIFEIELLQIQ